MIGEATLAWVAEALAPRGHVSHRRMMGGWTLYLDAVIFALIDRDGGLWFKSDAVSDPAWDAAGCERFGYDRDGKRATMNDRRAPDITYDDAEELARCAPRRRRRSARCPKATAPMITQSRPGTSWSCGSSPCALAAS